MRAILGAVALGFVLAGELPELGLRVTPQVAIAPAVVTVALTIRPHADNRSFCTSLDADDYSRSSCETLNGADAHPEFAFVYRRVPAGEYYASAALYRMPNPDRPYRTAEATLSIR